MEAVSSDLPRRVRWIVVALTQNCIQPMPLRPAVMNRRKLLLQSAGLTLLGGCSRVGNNAGTEVVFASVGDEQQNRYLQGPVSQALEDKYGVRLRLNPVSNIAEFVNKLRNEKRAGKASGGSADIVSINGGNFRNAKQAGLLYGPFADSLPSAGFYPDTARQKDFGTPVEGYEAPWQRMQFVFAYDQARVPQPPTAGVEALSDWLRAHPNRFTYPAPPESTGSAFIHQVLVGLSGGEDFTIFDPALYDRAARRAFVFLRELRPCLWRAGETYPATAEELDHLFAGREVDFSMSCSPAFASARISRGVFPPTVRTFVLQSGTLSTFSYLAIPFNAPNVRGATLAINYLLSLDAALDFSRALQTPFAIDRSRLTVTEKARVDALPRGTATLSESELTRHAVTEPDLEYLIRFERDWRKQMLGV